MFLLGKYIKDVQEDDIKRLIDLGISESKTLEYKMELKIDADKDKNKAEFLADITALANTDGGIIIYGIKEEKDEKGNNKGVPFEVTGIIVDNKDKLIPSIEDIIRSGTDPKINSPAIHFVLVEGKTVLLIGISKFAALPHMVTAKSSNFYKRRNSGKYPVDTNELNDMFMSNFTINERVKNFVSERIAEVSQSNMFPEPVLEEVGSFFMHIIPISHMNESMIDLTSSVNKNYLSLRIPPIGRGEVSRGLNLEAFYIYSTNNNHIYSYQQVFRNGSIEFYTLSFSKMEANGSRVNVIFIDNLEEVVCETIKSSIEIYQHFQIEPPYVVFINLRNVENCSLYGSRLQLGTSTFRRKHIQLPTSFIATANADIWAIMRPAFDILWQACGRHGSLNYGEDGSRLRT